MNNMTAKMALAAIMIALLAGCATMEANLRATKTSVVRIAGMDMANGGGVGPSFAIVGENDVVLPTVSST